MLITGIGLTLSVRAQQTGTKRTDLQRHDLGIPGRELATYVVEKGKPLITVVE